MKASCKPVKDGVKYNSLLDAVLSLDKNSFDTIIERMKDLPENNSPFIKKEFHGKVVFCNYGSGKTFASNLSRLQLKKDNFLEKVIYHVKNNPNGAFNESGRPVQYLLDSDYLFELISGYPADQFKDKNFETDYFPNMEKTAKAMKVLIKNNYTIVANVSYSRFLDNIFDKQDCSAIYNANVKELDAIVRTRAQIENKKAIDIKSIEKNVIAVSNLEGNVSSFIDITNSDKRDIASVLFEENRWSRWNLINLRVNNCIEKYGTETVQLALKDMFAKYETAIASNPNLSEEARNKFKAIDKYAIYEFLDDTKEKTLKVIREQGTLNLNDQSRKNIMRFFFDSSNIEDLKSILEACKENNVVPLVRISLKNDHDNIKIVLENLYRKKLLIPMNTSVLDTEDSFFKEKLFALPVKNDEDTINIIHEIITGTPAKLKELGGITYIDTNVATSTEFIDEEGNLKSEPTPPEKQGFIVEKPRLEKKEIPSIKINSRDKDSEAASVYADKELLQEGIKDSDIVYINTISSVSYPWQIITINALLESGNTIIIGKSNPFYEHFTEKNPFPSLIEDEITEEGRTLAVFYLPKQENSSAGIKVTTNIESTIPLSESKKKLFEDFLNSSFTEKERDKIVSASFVFQDGVTVENLKYEPGEQQKEALYKIEDFIKSDKKYFVLKGYAGTGKTTIAKIIADKLSQQGIEFFFTASTNTAAGVLKASTNQYVTTFQRLFGFRYKQGKEGGESIQSIGYDISNQEIPDNFVLLVDESSMIKEGEFEDLTNILNKKNGKVIFMGDSAQLRPVEKGENNTKSKIFRLSQEEDFNPNEDMFELTEVMRNSGAILKVATQLRGENGVSDPRIMTHSMIDEDNRGIIVTKNENKELQQYVEKILKDNNGKLDNNIFKALTFTNQRANELNKEIRQYFHNYNSKGEQPISGLPIEGDYITLNQNLEDKEHIYFAKSDTVQIKKINGIQKEEITLLKENKQVNFELTVTSYSIEKDGMTKNIKICDIDVKDTNKTPDQLEIAKRNRVTLLEYKNNSVLGVDGYSLAKQYGIFLNDDVPQVRVDSKNGKIIEDNKTKARSRTVSFGYAMTIHKSQGQTISNIVIDANDIISKTFNPEFRGELLYTAVTRAKDSVLEITSSASTMDPEKGKYENFKITTSINNQPIPTTNQERWQQVSAMYDGPYKEFASLVFQKCSDFNVNLEQVTEEFIATNTTLASRGYFRPDENTVFINQYHQNNSELLLHEAIHALTSWAIDNVNTINDYEITIAVNKIKGVYKVLRENGLYFENEKELLAELANPKVREKLKKISLLSTVVDSIKKIFNKLLGDSYSGTNDAITVLEESLSTILEKANIEQIKANTEREKNRSIIMTHLSKFSQEEQDKMPYHHLLDGRFVNDEAIDLSDAELKEIADNIGNIETKLFNYDPSNNEYDATEQAKFKNIQNKSNSNTSVNNLDIKEGVEELFNSNPKLADQVYEALGFDNKSFTQFIKGNLDGSKLSQEIEGKLEANKDRLIELLGSSMYSEKLKDVVYKELLQNAFDATKIAEAKGLIDKGKIDIEVNEKERIISFTDNGIGMNSDIVQKAFFTIGGTYKGDDVDNKLKSGGLGLAKMAFIFGSETLNLETVYNGVKTTVNATSQEIRTDNFKIKTENTNEKNGTKVSVKIPKTYIDSKGNERDIDFPTFLELEFQHSFLSNPLIGNVDVSYSIINRDSSYREEETIQTNLGKIPEGFILFSPAKTSFADMDIYIDTNNITRGSYLDTKHKILSSGLYQFEYSFKKDNNEIIPLNIIIDIKPKVDATNSQYPFNNQRENFKPTIKNDIGALNKYLGLLWNSIEIELLKNSFSKIKNIEAVDVENVDSSIIEKNKEITKKFTSLSNSDIITSAIEDFSKINEEAFIEAGGLSTKELSLTKEDIDKDAEKAYSRTFKADKAIIINKDTGLDLDNNKPIIHNNTNMNIDAESTKFLSEVSSIMLDYKKSIIDFYGEDYSPNLKEQLWGVSIDKTYGGINVNPSILNMLAINPFYNFPTNPKVDAVNYVAVALDHLVIHELNHNFERNEGAGFTGRFLTTYSEIHSLPNYFELMSKLKLTIKNNLQIIKKLNYEYGQSENVESGFEGNKLEENNKRRTDIRTNSISQNDSTNNDRTTNDDKGSSEKFGEIINNNQPTPQQKQEALQLYSQYLDTGKQDIEGFKNFVNNSNQKYQTVQSDQIYSNLGNKTQSENVVIDEVNGIKPAVGSNVKLTKKNIFTVKPIQSIDKKAIVKASIATQYIGFGEGVEGSSTALYAKQISEQSNNITPKVNSGNYSSNDVIFVSIGGKRGNEQIRKEQQDRTIKEALKAIEAGATLITDNKSYVESSDYNEGEKRLAKNLDAKGYTYSEQTIDGQILGIWSKSQSSNQIVAYRTKGNNFLEALEKDNAIGNPFGPYGQFKTPAGKVAVVEFIAWMIGEKHTDKLQDYRQSIIDKIPEMKGNTILYYKELGEASHATALDYLINKYDWRNNRPIAFNEQQSTTVKPAIRDIYEKTISSFLSAPVKKTSQEIISENLSKRKESVCDTNLCRVLMEELSKNLVVNGEKINDVDVPEIYITPMHKVLPILETILKQKNIPFTKAIDVLKYSISSIYMGKVLSNEESLTNDPTFFELANFLYLNTAGEDVKIDETVSIMNIARNNTVRLNDKETAEAVYGLNNVSDKRELLDRLPALITGSLEIGDLITNERALILCPELSKMTIEVNPNITESIIIKKTKDKAVPVLSLRRLSDSQGVIDEKVANKIESAIALFIQAKSGFLNGITSLNYEKNFQQLKDLNGLIITKLNLLESSSEEQRNTDKFKAIQYEVNMLNDTMYQLLKGLYKYNDDNPFANKQTVEILPISRKLSETAMKSSAYNGARLNPDGSVNLNSEQARTVMQSLGIYPVTEKKQLCRVP